MDLSVIIVNYNGKQDLLRSLSSLAAVRDELACEVIVVDNGSTDGSVAAASAEFPWVQFLNPGKNLGFAAGCNLGMAASTGKSVLLLNPDTEVLPGALITMVRALNEHPKWGIVGPLMVDAQDRPYRAARRFPSPFFLFCESTRLAFFFPRSRWFSSYFYSESAPQELDAVDQVEGSALMISEAARKAVGPMDERFFLFYEEVDWCKRVHDAGFEIHLVPTARIRHHRATTMSRFYANARIANAQSAMKYFQKHEGVYGLRKLQKWMRIALRIRMIITGTCLLVTQSETLRLKYEGAHVEYQEYRKGLKA